MRTVRSARRWHDGYPQLEFRPVDLTVFTDVAEGTFDVLDTGKRRNAADVLAIEGEKSATMLAAMVRTVWLFEHRPDLNWSGGRPG
jgi:hypothetical protein